MSKLVEQDTTTAGAFATQHCILRLTRASTLLPPRARQLTTIRATMSTPPEPTFWYKILDAPPPTPLPTTLPTSALDARDGFIHLSIARQIPITAGRFFAAAERIWVLQLRREKIDGRVEYPPEQGKACPHIHDSRTGLGKENVESVIELRRGEGQEWADAEGVARLVDH